MKNFNLSILLIALLCFFIIPSFAQSPTSLKKKCVNISTYAQVQIDAVGNINVNPCPGKTTVFTQTATLPGGVVLTALANGSAAAPAVNFINSATTGLYRAGADIFGISTAGVANSTFSAAANASFSALHTLDNAAGTGEFKFVFTPGAAALGSTIIGDSTGAGKTNLTITNSTGTAALQGIVATIGDGSATVGGLTATYTDSTNTAKLDNTAHTVIRDETGVNKYNLQRTVTAAGTTGAQTINKPAGTVNFAAAATAIVVTDSTAATTSLIFTSIRTADTTCTFVKSVVPAAGSFTITLNAGCNAETSVAFWVTN